MKRNSKLNRKILLAVTAVMFLCFGLTTNALALAMFDASMTSTLTLTGVENQFDPGLTDIFDIGFLGTLELDPNNIASAGASIAGTSVSYTTFGGAVETSTDIAGDILVFDDIFDGFGVGDSFTLNSMAFGDSFLSGFEDAFASAKGTLDFDNFGSDPYRLDFNLAWSMSANTTPDLGINAVAETFIFADLNEDSGGATILADTLGRSVNGVANFTDFSISSDFSVFVDPGFGGTAQIVFNEALGFLDAGGEAILDPVNPVNPVPEPATVFLLGSGLAGLAGFRRRMKKNKAS